MSIQGAIENLVKVFLGFYIVCAMVGRADIPWKMIAELRGKALAGASAGWGCPSAFNKNACKEYDPKNYK
jgi:hypothetical protein